MTENPDNAGSVRLQGQGSLGPVPKVKVKEERVDVEVETKLKALITNPAIKGEDTDSDDSDSTEELEDKKAIEPVKSSNEILAELFSVFNAAPPVELLDDKNLLKKVHKKVKKKKKSRRKTKSDGECSNSDEEVPTHAPSKHSKHKHNRKKHKHKHKDNRDRDKDKDKEREQSRIEKNNFKSESHERKRKHQATEPEEIEPPTKKSGQPLSVERERGTNSTKETADQRHSDVSLSDEETYLREKADGRNRAHNSFYDNDSQPRIKEEPNDSRRYSSKRRHRSNSRHRSRSSSRTRSRSRDLGIDKKRLLEIARRNAISMVKRGTIPGVEDMSQEVKDKVLLKMRYGGRTVQDLTEFCKKISNGEMLSELSSDEDSDVDKNGNAKAFHHPFQLREREPIVMHIRNSTPIIPAMRKEDQTKAITMQFPVSSGQVHRMSEVWVPVERKDALPPLPALPPAKQSTNIFKDIQMNVFAKPLPQQEQQEPAFKSISSAGDNSGPPPMNGDIQVASTSTQSSQPAQHAPLTSGNATPQIEPRPLPVSFIPEVPIPSTATPALPPPALPTAPPVCAPSGDSIFPQVAPPNLDVSSIIMQRLNAIRRLQNNPTDTEAYKMMHNAQLDMSSWVSSKHLPGQFTGSTGAQVMKVRELNSGPQLWTRRDQLTSTKPVTGGMGMALLQKMGWRPGEGLGRTKTGSLQPLLLDVKLDKRGLVSREDLNCQPPRTQTVQRKAKSNELLTTGPNSQLKHPVCILNELTSKNKWTPPHYTMHQDMGPPHNRMFLISVEINGTTYTPPQGASTKKDAKLNAAKVCLEAMGLLPPKS